MKYLNAALIGVPYSQTCTQRYTKPLTWFGLGQTEGLRPVKASTCGALVFGVPYPQFQRVVVQLQQHVLRHCHCVTAQHTDTITVWSSVFGSKHY